MDEDEKDIIAPYTTPSGQISMWDVRAEVGRGGQVSLNDRDVRLLANKTSGQISMSDLRGQTYGYRMTVGHTIEYAGSNPIRWYYGFIGGSIGSLDRNDIIGRPETIIRLVTHLGSSAGVTRYYTGLVLSPTPTISAYAGITVGDHPEVILTRYADSTGAYLSYRYGGANITSIHKYIADRVGQTLKVLIRFF